MPEHHRAFGSLFFLLHQGKLLWLLNAPVVGRWFRWCMRIRRWDIGPHERICAFAPDHFTVRLGVDRLGRTKYRTDFRTHAKFSKRLYYAFRPLWWTLHAWDWAFADRWIPELSFGFSTLTSYPDAHPETNTVDGRVSVSLSLGSGESWATMHDRTSGTAADTTLADEASNWISADNTSNQWIGMHRGFFLFYTAALTSASVISAAVMSLYGTNKGFIGPFIPEPSFDVCTTSPASNTDLVVEDFDQVGSVSQTGGSPITYGSWNTAGYNDFTFNSTGIGNINKTGISKFGTREATYDIPNTSPTWANQYAVWVLHYFSDQTGTTNDPKLVVTYTKPESYIIIAKNWALE